MPKCSGIIGYALAVETQPGVWTESITEKTYYGDVVKDNRRIVDQSQINDNLNISNNISVVCNSFMFKNMAFMKFITFIGSKWEISSVDIKPPRIIITIGGIYNE
jgi:hypothetical protein